jgi:hypothetical protein
MASSPRVKRAVQTAFVLRLLTPLQTRYARPRVMKLASSVTGVRNNWRKWATVADEVDWPEEEDWMDGEEEGEGCSERPRFED